ncbi:sensor domain-containing diguanylate cyclase [Henriciella barbarensis]|nr:sensor domain-containing diguanylate cyclase [Henriciella barbarensis]
MINNLTRKGEGGNREAGDEANRLEALESLGILDTPREPAYDRIVRLVRASFDCDMALISVLDAHRQWYKAIEGADMDEVPVQDTFCRRTINMEGPLVVEDAAQHPNFKNNPYVTAENGVRFYAGIPLKTKNGFSVGTLCAVDSEPRVLREGDLQLLEDLATIVVEQMELREQAMTDDLTGALSRRAFRSEGSRLAALASRHRHPLPVICFDLDHFKAINDTFGHSAGDEVLRTISQTVQKRMRRSDVFARLGGEEFAVLLPETERRGGVEVAEALRRDISALRFDFGGKSVNVTASFGLASFDGQINDLDTLLQRADAALYQSKKDGRNRITAWGDGDVSVKIARRRVLKGGKISFRNGGSTIDCTVRTLGQQGAGLDMIATTDVPNEFRLLIKADGLDAKCEVTSRTRTHLEVEFV